jgi:hypothetical protein
MRDPDQRLPRSKPTDANRCHTIPFAWTWSEILTRTFGIALTNSQRLRLTFSQLTNIRRIHNLTDAHAIATATDISTPIEKLEFRICAACDKTDCSIPPSTTAETPKKAGSGNCNLPSCNHPAENLGLLLVCERLSGQTALFFLCHLPIHITMSLPGPPCHACAAAQISRQGCRCSRRVLANE